MAGGDEGSLTSFRRCADQSVEVEDLAGDGRKRKTSEDIVCGAQLFAPLMEELANRKKAADGAAAAAAAEEEDKGAVGEKPPGPKARMSEREIRWILSRKPMPVPRQYEDLKQSNPDLMPLSGEMDNDKEDLYFWAKVLYCMEERFPKLQEWVCEELATKGYVEMDDDWVKRRAEADEAFEEGCKEVEKKIKELQFSEDEIDYLRLDYSDSDYDDDEESDNDRDNNDGEEEEQ